MPSLIAWQDKQAIAVGQDALRYVYKDQRKTSVKEPLDYNRMMSSVAPLVQAGMKQLESPIVCFVPGLWLLCQPKLPKNNYIIGKPKSIKRGLQD